MNTIVKIVIGTLVMILTLSSCSSTQSLQEYYVDNTENPNFLSFDIPASVLNLEEADLTGEQREAINSLRKLNILAFKKTANNDVDYQVEKEKVKAILKNKKFVELMKLNTSYGKGVVKYLGDEDAIDEVVIYGNNKEQGFVLVRVLGNDMNPAHMVQLMQAMSKSDYKGEGFGPLGDLFKS